MEATAATRKSVEIASTFKILLIGDSNVGKSSILLRFTDDKFLSPEDTSATIGVDFKVKMLEIDERRYKLTIWDTAGQERFRTLTSSYYRGAQGVILVYDVSKRESFEHLDNWVEELSTYCPSGNSAGDDDGGVVKMVVGNKVDKESERQVSRKEGAEYARKHQTLFLECSAKTKIGVQQAMEELVCKIIDTPSLWRRSPSNTRATVTIDDSVTSGCAC